MRALQLLFVLVQIAPRNAREVLGALHLDSYTFDKVIAKQDVLVKFDKYIPYGPKEDSYKALSKKVGELSTDLIIGWVGVQDYGEKVNEDLLKRFELKMEDLPQYFLFKRGQPPVRHAQAEMDEGALLAFLKASYGLYVSGADGCIESGDKLALQYMGSSSSARLELLAEMESTATALEGSEADSAALYVKTMQKITEKGDAYPAQEIARLNKLLEGKLSEEKKRAFRSRINILSTFLASSEALS